MPFDGNTSAPSLTMLSEILRDGSKWPKGFVWDYRDCESCAFGMAQQLWNLTESGDDDIAASASRWFSMPEPVACDIFAALHLKTGTPARHITPEMVADAIDAHLAGEVCERRHITLMMVADEIDAYLAEERCDAV